MPDFSDALEELIGVVVRRLAIEKDQGALLLATMTFA
jgi:hypothetical protein